MLVQSTALEVVVHGGRRLYNTNMLSKMDPYVIVTLGNKSSKTHVHQNGGRDPTWEETLTFNYTNEPSINFRVFDKDTLTADDFIGSAELLVSFVKQNKDECFTGDVPLTRDKGAVAGHLRVTVRFLTSGPPNNAAAAPATAPTQMQGMQGYPAGYPMQMMPQGVPMYIGAPPMQGGMWVAAPQGAYPPGAMQPQGTAPMQPGAYPPMLRAGAIPQMMAPTQMYQAVPGGQPNYMQGMYQAGAPAMAPQQGMPAMMAPQQGMPAMMAPQQGMPAMMAPQQGGAPTQSRGLPPQ